MFSIGKDGSEYNQLIDFSPFGGGSLQNDGRSNGSLVITDAGVIYGVTAYVGPYGSGVVYRINTDGTHYQKLVDFSYSLTDPSIQGGLVYGNDGFLYGTHQYGTQPQSSNRGSLFKVAVDGSGLTQLVTFAQKGLTTSGDLIKASDGRLYGIAGVENSYQNVLYRLDTDGSNFTVVQTFNNSLNSGLHEGGDGFIYGTVAGGGTFDHGYAYRCTKDGASLEIIHHFDNDAADPGFGFAEYGGWMYGITYAGGNANNGVVYRMKSDGSGFEVVSDISISGERSELSVDADGVFFFTFSGGADDLGALHRVSSGTSEVINQFHAEPIKLFPNVSLTEGPDHNLIAPITSDEAPSAGYIFSYAYHEGTTKLTQNTSGLAMLSTSRMQPGDDGNWYWIAYYNGSLGSIVRGTMDGSNAQPIYNFGQTTGWMPFFDLIIHDGYVYGSCQSGGTTGKGYNQVQSMPTLAIGGDGRLYGADGGVFSMRLDGSDFKTLRNIPTDRFVSAPLTLMGSRVYGVLSPMNVNGPYRGGLFSMDIDGNNYNDTHTFTNTDGARPYTALLPAFGELYGATMVGGANEIGTLFSISYDGENFKKLADLGHAGGYGVSLYLTAPCAGVAAREIRTPVSGNRLESSAGQGNQGYMNGAAITGAIWPTLEATESGLYQVQVVEGNCKSELSEAVEVTIAGVAEAGEMLSAYPNPTSGKFVVDTMEYEGQSISISIRNSLGIEVASYHGPAGEIGFDLSGKAGFFLISMKVGVRKLQWKLVVR